MSNLSLLTNVENQLLDICENGGSSQGLTRDDCFEIYRNWVFGKRIIDALPTYAMSVDREISIKSAPPEAIERFKAVSKELNQDAMIKRCMIYTRIAGFGGLFVAIKSDSVKLKDNLTFQNIQDHGIEFYALDSFSLTNNTLIQSPLNPNFMKPRAYKIQGHSVGDKRLYLCSNGEPAYLKYTQSAFNFSGTSTYQNLLPLIQSHLAGLLGLRRMASKGGAVILQGERSFKLSGAKAEAIEKSKELVANVDTSGILALSDKSTVNFFPLQGIGEMTSVLKAIEYEIMLGVSDTPKTLLLDESLVNGMAEGTNDFSIALLAINSFREKMLTPIYKFTDRYVMLQAFSDSFISNAIRGLKKYEGLAISQIRDLWISEFQFNYGSLIPEPESLIQARESMTLEKIQRAKDLGATTDFIEQELNTSEIFNSDVVLQDKQTAISGLVGENNEEL